MSGLFEYTSFPDEPAEYQSKDDELAQLRAAADELQRIRELIDPLNGQSIYDAVDALLHDESSAEIYKAEISEQARKLDEARKALLAWHIVELNECGEDIFPLMKQLDEIDLYESGDDLSPWAQELRRAWLAANPAPQDQQP